MPLFIEKFFFAPGPETCIPCLEAYRQAMDKVASGTYQDAKDQAPSIEGLLSEDSLDEDDEAPIIEGLLSEDTLVCTRQYPKPNGANLSKDPATSKDGAKDTTSPVCAGITAKKIGSDFIPVLMRGDAFDLQDLIKFLISQVEDELQQHDSSKESERFKACLSSVQRQLFLFVATLIGEFIKVVAITQTDLINQSSSAIAEQIHRRRTLAAMRYPFPTPDKDKEEFERKKLRENMETWEKRCESRLLAEDPGFLDWRAAKIAFHDNVDQLSRTSDFKYLKKQTARFETPLVEGFPLILL
ncbi:hypothetical protein QBC41DRAFT_374670 [Cercophora samala]|uniref:Uncharacterized protein n=1 Tax=Cercophora samala TaxID=330535 RepID=A0AA39ZAR3_9PEZI|nr:hypothetical protein QBC41DRAFT_374670 [Cercophora samala]